MLKYIFLWGCYTCVVDAKYTNVPKVNCKVNNHHYVEPNISVIEWDSLQINDTIRVNKKTLKLCYKH